MIKKEKTIFDNGFFEFVEVEEEHEIEGKKKDIFRNMVRRTPGIRALIVDKSEKKILLSREYRYELEDFDYRLPGGKVFDTLNDYKESLKREDVEESSYATVFKEVSEEVGLIVRDPKLIKVSKAGAGVVWDLYYYEITDYDIDKNGAHLEDDEIIDGFVWKTFDEVQEMCISGEIHEDRTVGVLLSYILKFKN